MAWNKDVVTKSLRNGQTKGLINVGAPVAFDVGKAGRPYRDGWNIERAYSEGMRKVTWVFRAIDAIASNQAQLPIVLRKDNDQHGELTKNNKPLLEVFNSKANIGENSFTFRYRVSSQLLMSTRGVFIEKIRGRDGRINALHLLPPGMTAPIPDPRRFVSGFEVDLRNGSEKKILKPEDVCWIRRPHPLDPYLSLTPMESAGIAIELENLAKLYNRNYLLNDGRPGGIVVVRGDMEQADKDELRNRFRGNLAATGHTTVLASSEGVDYVDTSASPRDVAYIQMRQISKEEILTAFGTPESVLGNASGRTFSNASEELRVYWMETMKPHLTLLARAFDELDDDYYVDFDTSGVPILVMAKQERERYVMDEFQQGLISANEYRVATGRKKVDSELADSLLSNPNLTPIANTEKPFKTEQQLPVDMIGVDPNAPVDPNASPAIPPVIGAPPAPVEIPGAESTSGALSPDQVLTAQFEDLQTKMHNRFIEELETKADSDTERWVEIMDRALERLFERQQRVVMEKTFGAKSSRALASGTLVSEMVFDQDVWDKQLADDIKPVILAIYNEAKEYVDTRSNSTTKVDEAELQRLVEQQIARMQQANQSTLEEITAAVLVAMAITGEDERSTLLRASLLAIFVALLKKRKRDMAEHEAQTSYNIGVYLAGKDLDSMSKTWITRKDSRVRETHQILEGKTVDFGDGFIIGDAVLRFPGDPLAPPSLTYNCRCRLRFRFN